MDNESYLSDESIVKLYFSRDENAIAQTDLKYGKLLHTVAYNCLNDDECAKECRNDTYLETWNRIPPEYPKLLRAFLCKITRCIAINRYKQMRAKRRVPSELTVSMEDLAYTLHSGDTAGAYDAKELGRVIGDFVRSLPQKQRYIFMERYYMAGSVSDIAKALRLTDSAVYKELTKIKLGLKMHLERNEIYI